MRIWHICLLSARCPATERYELGYRHRPGGHGKRDGPATGLARPPGGGAGLFSAATHAWLFPWSNANDCCAYFEDSRYVPLLARAYELWQSLQADSGVPLLHIIGGLMIGRPTSDLVARSQASAERFEIPHELLTAAELCRRHPALRVDNDWVGLWERDAGYLIPEMCIEQQLRLASLAGADLHFNEPAELWEARAGGGVQVRTARATYSADRLVITAGPWSSQVLQALSLPLTITRQVVYLFQPIARMDLFRSDRLPVYIGEMARVGRLLDGFP